ncbi:ABC transporter ATP-binding protein [Clostridium tagluense]|uniref:ABC transporter ATP-binding protein n=1 Tax=Clostridium tagluense TaxID=360422 RepID=UPI001CF39B2E|nr:ABC transporter ATP-binding protein [Clostridium tagluense]MCB2300094.1 ABC transporter ATP-binding protein/permease [Clostridium tagluense]
MKQTGLKWIYSYTKTYLWTVVLLAIISGAIALSFILLALVSSQLLDIATSVKAGSVLQQCLLLLGLIVLQAVLNIISSNIRIRVSGKMEISMKQRLFSLLLKKQYLQITKIHSGEILNRFTSDIQIVVNGVVTIIPQVISLMTKLSAGLFVLARINLLFTAIVSGLGVVMYFSSRIYSKHFKYLHKEVQQSDGKTRSFIQECVENITFIKSFMHESWIKQKLEEYQGINYKAKVKRNGISNIANTSSYVMVTSGYFLTLAWGAMQISKGVMTFGTLTAFLQIIEQIKAPFRNMSGLIPQYYSMIASAERLLEIEGLQDEIVHESSLDVREIYKGLRKIVFEDVYFAYEKKLVFEGANLIFYKGDMIGVAGESGVGKSTLIKLILGLVNTDSGKIYFDVADKQIMIDAGTRALFAYVPQGNMILSGTLKENISFYNPDVDEERLIHVAKIACIYDFIQTLPKGFDTAIGERGIGLSEGQVQRLAIARAILSHAPILLLDECTSALDEKTEWEVLENIKAQTRKTVICISHRPATIKSCDRVIHIENKRIVEYI